MGDVDIIAVLVKTCVLTSVTALLLGIFSFVALKIVRSVEVRVIGVTVMNVLIFIVMLVVYMFWAGLVNFFPDTPFFKGAMFPVLCTTFMLSLFFGLKEFGKVNWGRAALAAVIAVILPGIVLYLLLGREMTNPEKFVEIATNPFILFK